MLNRWEQNHLFYCLHYFSNCVLHSLKSQIRISLIFHFEASYWWNYAYSQFLHPNNHTQALIHWIFFCQKPQYMLQHLFLIWTLPTPHLQDVFRKIVYALFLQFPQFSSEFLSLISQSLHHFQSYQEKKHTLL